MRSSMKSFIKLTLFLLSTTVATKSWAGLLVEPFLGYEIGSTLQMESGSSNGGGKTTGLDLGVRVGYKLPMMLWFAADYSMMSGGVFKADTSGNDGKIDRSNLYIDVGFDLPVLARVWLGYGVMNSFKSSPDSGGSSSTIKDGTNIKLGVGLKTLPFLSINLEYFMHDYAKVDPAISGSTTLSDSFSSHKESGLMLGVSVPFNL